MVYLLGKEKLEEIKVKKRNQGFNTEYIRFEILVKYKEEITG